MITDKEKELFKKCIVLMEDKHDLKNKDEWRFIKDVIHRMNKSINDLK